jgi:hypothetical protein
MDEPVCPGCRGTLKRKADLEARVVELTRKPGEATCAGKSRAVPFRKTPPRRTTKTPARASGDAHVSRWPCATPFQITIPHRVRTFVTRLIRGACARFTSQTSTLLDYQCQRVLASPRPSRQLTIDENRWRVRGQSVWLPARVCDMPLRAAPLAPFVVRTRTPWNGSPSPTGRGCRATAVMPRQAGLRARHTSRAWPTCCGPPGKLRSARRAGPLCSRGDRSGCSTMRPTGATSWSVGRVEPDEERERTDPRAGKAARCD